MTENHQYNTPAEGASNWDEPLNDNFVKLDSDVEIRDVDSNLGNYNPKGNAKFLATDTGTVYLGDGSSWNEIGSIVRGSLDDGSIVAQPGDVQNSIDTAAASDGGLVRLDPTSRYEHDGSFPWIVKENVTLDFNGAILYGSGSNPNVDIIHLTPTAQVHNPKIDLFDNGNGYTPNTPYEATVFTVDAAQYGSYFSDGTTVRGGWTMAVECLNATWFHFKCGGGNHCTVLQFDTNLRRPIDNPDAHTIGTGIFLDSTDGTGFLNSIRFDGTWRGAGTMILQDGTAPNNEHIFDCVIQQEDGADYIWHILPDTFARGTVLRGMTWDVNSETYPDGVAWLIDSSNPDCHSNHIHAAGYPPSMTVNNSGNDHYVTDARTNQTTVV